MLYGGGRYVAARLDGSYSYAEWRAGVPGSGRLQCDLWTCEKLQFGGVTLNSSWLADPSAAKFMSAPTRQIATKGGTAGC